MDDSDKERSLDLDLDETGRGDKARRVARVAVVGTRGFTRDGSEATITSDCESAAALDREIARLRGELDDVLERGRELLGAEAHGAKSRRAGQTHRGATPASNDPG